MHTWEEAVTARRELYPFRAEAWKKGEESMLRWLAPHLAGVELGAIDADKLRRITAAKLAEGVGPLTVNAHLALVRAVLRSACEWGWITSVPKFRMLRKPPPRVRHTTPERAAKLLSLLPPHSRDMALFSLETGLRRSNVTGLLWEWIDLKERMIHIPATSAKGRRPLSVPLSAAAVRILRRWRGQHATHAFHYLGRPITQANTKAFRRARQRAGLGRFRWHDLRHTWASWHTQSGTPAPALMVLGGWSTLDMVKTYNHLQAESLRPWVQRVKRVRLN